MGQKKGEEQFQSAKNYSSNINQQDPVGVLIFERVREGYSG